MAYELEHAAKLIALSTNGLEERQIALLRFVGEAHDGQLRKYTHEPYVEHLVSVAFLANRCTRRSPLNLNIEIALCHDLFEDTQVDAGDLEKFLYQQGYQFSERQEILKGIRWLTDVYTKEEYPSWNRAWRKEQEAIRISKAPDHIVNIKVCDFIDNTRSIVDNDPHFAKVYMKEKRFFYSLVEDRIDRFPALLVKSIFKEWAEKK